MRTRWLAALFAFITLALAVGLSAPANAQATDAAIQAQCSAKTALPAGGWTYKTSFVTWTDVQWGVQNPFPGRNAGEVHTELMVSAAAVFECKPDLNGANPQNLPTFLITFTPRGTAYLQDIQVCSMQGGSSKMTIAFPGANCPFAYRSGFNDTPQFTGQGPYSQLAMGIFPGNQCFVYGPTNLEANLRHPIIVWGNGTGGSPAGYESLFAYWASYGFVVVAAATPNAGTGNEMINCLDMLLNEAKITASPFYRKLNPYRVAAAGHSQGGGGAIMAGRDPRIGATVPFMPYILPIGGVIRHDAAAHAQQAGPMLLISGALDTLATPTGHQQVVFNSANVPVVWGTEAATGHSLNTSAARASLPFLRWQLMQHDLAQAQFGACTLCADANWSVQKKGVIPPNPPPPPPPPPP